jgi:hypothetical protein
VDFKLALRGKAIGSTMSRTQKSGYSPLVFNWRTLQSTLWHKIQRVDNVWDFSKFKHDDKDDPTVLKMKVSKLISNILWTAQEYDWKWSKITLLFKEFTKQDRAENLDKKFLSSMIQDVKIYSVTTKR